MRQWSATIKNFYKGRYYNNEQVLSVKAGKVNTAVHRAVGRYLANLPKGTRIEGLSITIQAIRVKSEKEVVEARLKETARELGLYDPEPTPLTELNEFIPPVD